MDTNIIRSYFTKVRIFNTFSHLKGLQSINYKLSFFRELRPNLSYLYTAGLNTQSTELSTLTDMLPHKGRVIKQKDLNWGTDSCLMPVKMTNDPETHFGKMKGCFTNWADNYTLVTGYHPY